MNSLESRPQPDEQLGLIAAETRRHLLVALLADSAGDEPIDLAARAGDAGFADRVELRHVHLPKLADRGLVRWDRENQLVWRGRQFDAIEPLLTLLHDHADELPDEWL